MKKTKSEGKIIKIKRDDEKRSNDDHDINISINKCLCSAVPLVIHMLFCAAGCVAGIFCCGAPNMLANGLPANCSRSSDAFCEDCC